MGRQKQAAAKVCLDTLAQTGTTISDVLTQFPDRLVVGEGKDLSESATKKKWAKRKLITNTLMLRLISVAEKKQARDRVKEYWNAYYCLSNLVSSDGRVHGRYCKNRFCTVCTSIRKASLINKYFPVLRTWEAPYFLTLTTRAVKAGGLPKRIKGMRRAFRLTIDKYKKRHQRGKGQKLIGVVALECNFNPQMQTYNPHFHLIVPNKETAEIFIAEWLALWTTKHALRIAQDMRPVVDLERDLVETIKYGSKIFTEADVNKKSKSKVPPMLYVAALDTIFEAFKGYRLFERFGFNLPKENKQNRSSQQRVTEFAEWKYHPHLRDWYNPETGELLTRYMPPQGLQYLLGACINTELQ